MNMVGLSYYILKFANRNKLNLLEKIYTDFDYIILMEYNEGVY